MLHADLGALGLARRDVVGDFLATLERQFRLFLFKQLQSGTKKKEESVKTDPRERNLGHHSDLPVNGQSQIGFQFVVVCSGRKHLGRAQGLMNQSSLNQSAIKYQMINPVTVSMTHLLGTVIRDFAKEKIHLFLFQLHYSGILPFIQINIKLK